MDEKHITHQLDAYMLGLLSPEERQAVHHHVAHCEACREALQREREMADLLRATLHDATDHDPVRLRQLMPPVPKKRQPFWAALTGIGIPRSVQKQFAAVTMVALLLIGSLGLQIFTEPDSFSVQAASMTETDTTATSQPRVVSTIGIAIPPTLQQVDSAVGTRPSRLRTGNVTPEPAPLAATPVSNLFD